MSQFEKFQQCLESNNADVALGQLADYFISQKRFHELFEIRKAQMRYRLGLPVKDWQSLDELPRDQSLELETGLLDACREVGELLVTSGDVAQGWQYLQPVGDRTLIRKLIREVEIDDENADAIIEIAIGHMVDPEFGFQLVIDRYGTCNSITAFDSQIMPHAIDQRRGPAAILVRHVYEDLSERVFDCICERESLDGDRPSLLSMIEERPWLFEGLSHHIDTTHLASTVKAARCLTEPETIDLAIELATYGSSLHEDFQYRDEPPFENIYADGLRFLKALRGEDVDNALAWFREKAEQSAEKNNLDPAQWYVYLLDQLGRGSEAWDATKNLIIAHEDDAMMSQAIAPDLFHIAQSYQLFDSAKETLMKNGDLLNFAILSVSQQQVGNDPAG